MRSRRARSIHPQPRDPVPRRAHHLSGRARDRADPQCLGRGLAASSSRSSAGSPPSPAHCASSHRRAPSGSAAALTKARAARCCGADLDRARRRPHLLRLHPLTNPQGSKTNEQARFPRRPRHPEGDHRADRRFAQDLHHAGRGARTCACRSARSCSILPRTSRRCAVYDSSGPYTDDNAGIDVEQGLQRARASGCASAAASRNTTAARSSRSTTATSPASTSRAISPTRRSRCAPSAMRR